ncbi:MBL fold metallo-hydrolase [Halomarina ordinaria]|uniref:MBL fold metallo-hydrolase n=1 Tax=Halomarina ordinaria TaxID=3033939 RepID=A0ABD5U466_9EURY|nr:MBL fold metallo-hydrolase [Halomarina sp. PSRA2]
MPTELVPDVYDLTLRTRGAARYRAFLVDGDTPTLFDCGFPDTTDVLREEVDATGVTPERLVVTHADGDHVGGLEAVVEAYGAETYLPEGGSSDVDGVDHRYGDGDRIGEFVAVATPGHRDDHHALVDEGRSLAVLGDAVSGSDQRGIPPGYFVLPPAVYSEDLHEAEASLERLLDYDFDAALLYHGSSVLEDASERLRAFVEFVGRPT